MTTATAGAPDLAAIKQRQQATWASGDYHMIGTQILIVAEQLIESLDVHSTDRVLDVATGSGNAALAAARRGCEVVGIDYVPSLLERARQRAAVERLEMRLDEGDQVMSVFAKHLGANVIRVDAEKTFLGGLAGVADPEQKRKIIGRLFVEVFDAEAEKIKDVRWLAQGTIYPDVIESAGAKTGKAHLIKSHHNVGGLPERMNLKLLEPLRDLFKDEVRNVGRELGLPEEIVGRHPFPGRFDSGCLPPFLATSMTYTLTVPRFSSPS